MEVFNVSVLACLMNMAQHSPASHNPGEVSPLQQTKGVRFNLEMIADSHSSTESARRPGFERIMSIENYLNLPVESVEKHHATTKGTPLSAYQAANYKQSQEIRNTPRRSDNCLVYRVEVCKGRRCQTAERGDQSLQFAEVWLKSKDVRSLTNQSVEIRGSANVSVDVFHRNPLKHRSSHHKRLGYATVDVSQSGLASKPWLYVDLQTALPFVECAFQRSKPIFIQLCTHLSSSDQHANSPTSFASNHIDPNSDSAKPFLVRGYLQEQQSLLQFVDSSNLRLTLASDQEDPRYKRNVPKPEAEVTTTTTNYKDVASRGSTQGATAPADAGLPVVNRTCGRVPFTLNLSSIDSTKVFRPPQLKLWYCSGACTKDSKTNSDFAMLRRLATSGSPDLQFEECCVPRRFSKQRTPIAWEDVETGEISGLRTLNDSNVEECGCT